jgi:predicted GNAT superfamily acetyltransferase
MPAVDSPAARASAQAEAAADAAGVAIRELTAPHEHDAAAEVFTRVWSLEPGQTLMPSGLMRVMAYEGCYVAGVFDKEDGDRPIGAAAAFLASDGDGRGIHLHSHIAGALPEAKGRHAGFALKLHQRAWALNRGIRRITWTFDPLVRGNAYFNLAKLGARATTYLVDFYGDMLDGVNAGQGSDRLLMDWALDSPGAIAAADGIRAEPPDVEPLLAAGRVLLSGIVEAPTTAPGLLPPTLAPVPTPASAPSRATLLDTPGPLLCATPAAIQTLRRTAPAQARRWRSAVRDALTDAVDHGYRVTGFTRSGWYLLEQHEEEESR